MTTRMRLSGLEILTFDLYGTVVDMQSGLTKAITPFLENKDYEGRLSLIVTWWRRTHFENSMIDALIDKGHTPLPGDRSARPILHAAPCRHPSHTTRGRKAGKRDRAP
jgi:hypothetical protein